MSEASAPNPTFDTANLSVALLNPAAGEGTAVSFSASGSVAHNSRSYVAVRSLPLTRPAFPAPGLPCRVDATQVERMLERLQGAEDFDEREFGEFGFKRFEPVAITLPRVPATPPEVELVLDVWELAKVALVADECRESDGNDGLVRISAFVGFPYVQLRAVRDGAAGARFVGFVPASVELGPQVVSRTALANKRKGKS